MRDEWVVAEDSGWRTSSGGLRFLVEERHLSTEDAYMLSSMAADLHVTQIVDGTKGIHAVLPKRIFVQK